jgi:hypothetical protein
MQTDGFTTASENTEKREGKHRKIVLQRKEEL